MEVNGNYQALLPNGHAEAPEVERAPLSETLIKSPRSRALPAPFAIDRQANEVGSAINAESSLRRRLWSHMDQSAGIRVFQQPQRTVGRFFHIANTFADMPALGRLGSPFTVEDDAIERHRRQAADKATAVPLRKSFGAVVEHEVARRDHRYPIEDRLRQVGPRVGTGNRHLVVVLPVGDEWPAVVFALLDQVQLVAAAGAMFNLP